MHDSVKSVVQNFLWRSRGRSKTGARSSKELEGLTMKMSQHDNSISRAGYTPAPSGADSLHFYRASKITTPPPSGISRRRIRLRPGAHFVRNSRCGALMKQRASSGSTAMSRRTEMFTKVAATIRHFVAAIDTPMPKGRCSRRQPSWPCCLRRLC